MPFVTKPNLGFVVNNLSIVFSILSPKKQKETPTPKFLIGD